MNVGLHSGVPGNGAGTAMLASKEARTRSAERSVARPTLLEQVISNYLWLPGREMGRSAAREIGQQLALAS
jgi:hypothetical protein